MSRQWATQRPVANPDVRVAAAQVVVELFNAGQGIPVRQLVQPGRPPETVNRAIRYLLARDWAGISKRGDRVWLLTPVRERPART